MSRSFIECEQLLILVTRSSPPFCPPPIHNTLVAADLHAETPAHALSPSLNSDRDLWKTRRLRPAHNSSVFVPLTSSCLDCCCSLALSSRICHATSVCVCVRARACTHARVHISVFTTQFARVDFAYMRATGMDVL